MSAVASPGPTSAAPGREVRRRVATAALLGVLVVALLLAVPGLRPVVRDIGAMSPAWIAVAVVLELASCVGFVVVFRLFFDRGPGRDTRALAWTSMASGALLPAGGVGGYAITGWLMSLTGAPARWIIRRSSGLFFLTSAVNVTAVAGAGVILLAGGAGPNDFLHAGLPVVVAAAGTLTVIALPRARRRRGAPWVDELAAGIEDAERALLRPSWRLLGAVGYLGFDIAVLWTTLTALGHAPPVAALVLGYSLGYLANTLPIPGGIGVLDGGLAGALLLYGAPPAHVAAAVLVYHAIALWLPGAGGLLAYARLSRRLVSNQAPEGGLDDNPLDDAQTHPRRVGRLPDQRPRARALPRPRSEVEGAALPGPSTGLARISSLGRRGRGRRRRSRSAPDHAAPAWPGCGRRGS